MIINSKPLSMAEASEYAKESKESETNVKAFIKKFTKLKPAEAKNFREKLEKLDYMKVKQSHIVKIIDLMPENAEGLNKIFTEIGLDGDETKKILEIVKEYK